MSNPLVKFRWAIFWRILPVAVIPIVAVGLLTRLYIQHTMHLAVERNNEMVATVIASSADACLRVPTELIQQAAGYLARPGITPAISQNYLQSIIDSSQALEVVLMLDDSGVVRQAAARPEIAVHIRDLLGIDYSRQKAFGMSRAATQPVWSPIGRSPWTGKRTISICQRIGNQTLMGVLNVESIERMLQVPAGNEACTIAVLDRAGPIYFRSEPSAGGFTAGLLSASIGAQGPAGRTVTTSTVIEGRDYIASAVPVPAAGWVVVVALPSSVAYAAVRGIDLLFIVLTIGSFVLVAASAMLLAGGLARPLQALSQASAAVAAGSYDMPLPQQQYQEIEELAHSFREMAAAIRRREDKLLSTQKTLNFAARGTAQGTGHAFFVDLVNVLSTTTGARCILVSEWTTGPKPRARILAARASVPLEADFTYEIHGNPCAQLQNKAILHISSGVSVQYSESPLMRLLGAESYIGIPLVLGDGTVGGHVAIVDDHELTLEEQMRNLLLVLAARGGAELERIQTDRRLQESESLYRAVVQDQTELICRSTIDGTLTFVNDAYCRYFGKRREELVARSFMSRVVEEDRELVRSYFGRLSPDRPTETVEYRVYAPTGEMRWQQWTNRIIVDAKGRIVEYQGTGRDITENRHVEVALGESEQRFRQLATSITSVFWLSDWATQKILYISPAFQAIWGISDSLLAENPLAWTIAIVEEDRARVVRSFLLHAAEGQYNEEYRITRPDGSTRWIRDRRFPIRNSENQVYRVAGLAEDITEQKSLEATLREAKHLAEQASLAKDQFLAALSHELRTPLTPVLLTTTAMEARQDLPADLHDELALVRTHVQTEVRLIDDLLDLTRIAAGRLPLHRRPTNVHDVLRSAILVCQSDLQSKPIQIHLDLSARAHCVDADPGRLQQVFWNLLKNAVRFTPAGGQLTISSRNPAHQPSASNGGRPQVSIEFADTGIGMDESTRQRLFEAFEQGTSQFTRNAGGVGLGLALSRAIIAMHGGVIRAHSDGIGHGSQFTIALQTIAAPAATTESESTSAPEVVPSLTLAPQLKLLVVEDHLPTARVLQHILRQQGHTVFWAPDVAAAFQAIDQYDFDLLISDLGLPDGNGHQLIAPFREKFNKPGIAISGFGTEQDVQEALAAGFSAHLVKPIDLDRLKAALALLVTQQHPEPTSTQTTVPIPQA